MKNIDINITTPIIDTDTAMVEFACAALLFLTACLILYIFISGRENNPKLKQFLFASQTNKKILHGKGIITILLISAFGSIIISADALFNLGMFTEKSELAKAMLVTSAFIIPSLVIIAGIFYGMRKYRQRKIKQRKNNSKKENIAVEKQ